MNESLGIRILLVRHGETEWNRTGRFQGRSDIPLNEKGREEAQALAQTLKQESITAIYSSPLARAKETALTIKTFHASASFFLEEGLMEMDLGDFEGMEATAWTAQYPDLCRIWQERPSSVVMPGGESLPEAQARGLKTLEDITHPYSPGATLLLCSHNFVILGILCHASGVSLDEFRSLKQGTGTLNVLYKYDDRFELMV